jgi:hypothetical protein
MKVSETPVYCMTVELSKSGLKIPSNTISDTYENVINDLKKITNNKTEELEILIRSGDVGSISYKDVHGNMLFSFFCISEDRLSGTRQGFKVGFNIGKFLYENK